MSTHAKTSLKPKQAPAVTACKACGHRMPDLITDLVIRSCSQCDPHGGTDVGTEGAARACNVAAYLFAAQTVKAPPKVGRAAGDVRRSEWPGTEVPA